jgi:hypothetical protein
MMAFDQHHDEHMEMLKVNCFPRNVVERTMNWELEQHFLRDFLHYSNADELKQHDALTSIVISMASFD